MQTGLLAILTAVSVLGVGTLGATGMMANPAGSGMMNGGAGGGMMTGGSCGMNGAMQGQMDGGMMNGSCDNEQMQDHSADCRMMQE